MTAVSTVHGCEAIAAALGIDAPVFGAPGEGGAILLRCEGCGWRSGRRPQSFDAAALRRLPFDPDAASTMGKGSGSALAGGTGAVCAVRPYAATRRAAGAPVALTHWSDTLAGCEAVGALVTRGDHRCMVTDTGTGAAAVQSGGGYWRRQADGWGAWQGTRPVLVLTVRGGKLARREWLPGDAPVSTAKRSHHGAPRTVIGRTAPPAPRTQETFTVGAVSWVSPSPVERALDGALGRIAFGEYAGRMGREVRHQPSRRVMADAEYGRLTLSTASGATPAAPVFGPGGGALDAAAPVALAVHGGSEAAPRSGRLSAPRSDGGLVVCWRGAPVALSFNGGEAVPMLALNAYAVATPGPRQPGKGRPSAPVKRRPPAATVAALAAWRPVVLGILPAPAKRSAESIRQAALTRATRKAARIAAIDAAWAAARADSPAALAHVNGRR